MRGFLDYLGIALADPDDVARPGNDAGVRIVTTAQHANINGTVHGGLIATLVDSVMGQAVRSGLEEGERSATVSMTVTYLAPAEVGQELCASAEVRRRGQSLVMAEADVMAGETPVAPAVAPRLASSRTSA